MLNSAQQMLKKAHSYTSESAQGEQMKYGKRTFIGLSAAALLTFTAWQSGIVTTATATAAAATATATAAVSAAPVQPANVSAQAGSTNITADAAITLAGDAINVDGDGVTVDGSTATITAAGSYSISGTLDDGQIVVDAGDNDDVTLILNGVDISNSSSAAINAVNAEDVILELAAGSTNVVSDGQTYVYPDDTIDEPNAAVFSDVDLVITGEGALSVTGNYNDGIATKDELLIESGTLIVNAADDGIRGKDSIVVQSGAITINAGGDGLKSDDDEDAAKGFITVEDGSITIVASGDAIAAQTNVLISGGEFALTSGGGSGATLAADVSAKAIKGDVSVTIDGGTFAIDAADDAIHSNADVTINGGAFTIASGDDAIHGDATLTINDGDIDITQSYEGVESNVITVNDGNIRVTASDDGINASSGAGESFGMGGGMGRPGQGVTTYTGDTWLYINGGTLVINSGGDSLDANGAIEMTGGTVIVHGPTNSGNGALDYDGTFNISGGLLVAAGSAGMAQAPSTSSSQNALLVNFSAAQAAGTLVHIEDSAGNNLLTFAPAKDFQSLVFSSPDLATGESYNIYTGGSASGESNNGLYANGTYTPGNLYTTVAVESVITQVGTAARGGRGARP